MIVIEVAPGQFERAAGNPTLTSLDGTRRAPLKTILHPSWTEKERAAFGVFEIEPAPHPGPDQEQVSERIVAGPDGKPVHERETREREPEPEPTDAERIESAIGLPLDRIKAALGR